MRNLIHIVYIINGWSLGGHWLIAGRWLHGSSGLSWVNGNRALGICQLLVDYTFFLPLQVILHVVSNTCPRPSLACVRSPSYLIGK